MTDPKEVMARARATYEVYDAARRVAYEGFHAAVRATQEAGPNVELLRATWRELDARERETKAAYDVARAELIVIFEEVFDIHPVDVLAHFRNVA